MIPGRCTRHMRGGIPPPWGILWVLVAMLAIALLIKWWP